MSTNDAGAASALETLRRPMDRRQFMRRAAVVGIGAAVMPGFLAACAAEATATPTPTATSTPTATPTPAPSPTPVPSAAGGANPLFVVGSGVTRNDIAIPSGGDQIAAYMARPAGDAPAPGVVVIHENRGLVPYVRDVVDGLASSGFVAVAPDLLSREGGTAQVDSASGALRAAPAGQHDADALAVVDYLKSRSDVGRIGIIGFCFGGAIVWRVSTQSADIAAAVPFYGTNPPLDAVPSISAAVYAVYGADDNRVNAGIEDITAALNAAGTTWDSKVYAGSPHAFMNHTREDRYNTETAPQAWVDALAWLDRHLRA